jgi:AAA family ATP:ADP antiporter
MIKPLKPWLDIHKNEWPFALYMFSYFFLVISTFWILKPLKKALFIQLYDQTGVDIFLFHRTAAQAEQIAKVGNMVIAFLAVVLFTSLAKRLWRERLAYVFVGLFVVGFLGYLLLVLVGRPNDLAVWTFYWFGDLFSTLMVATFFAFLNDSVTPDAAKRMYGLIGFGGVLGGVFGATFVNVWIARLSSASWLVICLGSCLAIAVAAGLAGREVRRHPPPASPAPAPRAAKRENPAWEGAKLVFRSRYLLAITAMVGLYELASAMMDFIFTATTTHYLSGPAIGQHFTKVFAITNWISMFVQLFLTSFVMTRLGVGVALLVLPVSMFAGSGIYFALPFLWAGSMMKAAEGAFSYSINQSAKEALYVPTTRDEKYKAKAFIDMFIQRFGKALAVVLSLVITTVFSSFATLRWLALIVVVVAAAWFFVARYAGREFNARAAAG